jgi:glycosyltransferase involved in cell wall biosynthesis
MAYGVVPVASAVGSIPEVLNRLKSGRALDSSGEGAFADAIASYVENPETWRSESTAALLAASQFTYETYVEGIAAMIRREFGVDLV